MGRKAKLKKQRRLDPSTQQKGSRKKKSDFIQRVEKEGYRFENIERSPEIPKENIEPQI